MFTTIRNANDAKKLILSGKPVSLKGLRDLFDDKPKEKKCDIVFL